MSKSWQDWWPGRSLW